MSQISSLRKAGVAFRVVRDIAGRSRMVNAAISAVTSTARSFLHVAHLLWLEVTGVVFLAMALSFAGASVKEYGKYHAGQVGSGRFTLAVSAAALFAWFGLSSFWRVRRKSQRS